MSRTTITLDDPVLRKVRDISHREHKTIAAVMADLVSRGLRARDQRSEPEPMRWHTKKMRAKVDSRDKEVLYRVLDGGR